MLCVLFCTVHLTVCYYVVTCTFQRGSIFHSCLNVKKYLAQKRHNIWSLSDSKGTGTHINLVRKWTLNDLVKLAKWLSCVVSIYLYRPFERMFLSCLVRVSEWLHVPSFFECQTLSVRNRRNIWTLIGSNGSWSRNHLVFKRALNHLLKLAKWLSCVVSTYLYLAFNCMFLLSHVRPSEWMHTLHALERSLQIMFFSVNWERQRLRRKIYYEITRKLSRKLKMFWNKV